MGFKRGIKAGLLSALLFIALSVTLLSAIIASTGISNNAVSAAAVIILSSAGYISAYVSTQIERKNGLAQGLICSGIIILTVLIFSLIFTKYISGFFIIKAALCLLAGCIGGIKGVNTKKTKERRR